MGFRRREEIEVAQALDLVRLARRGGSSFLYVVVVAAAVALILILSLRLRASWDASRSGWNVLSPQTLAILEELTEPVEIYPLFSVGSGRRENYWYRLQRYRQASSLVSVEFIDPVAEPGRVKMLGLSAEEESSLRDGDTLVRQGGRKRKFRGTREEDITNAIVDVGSVGPRVVGLIRGYGERDPGSGEAAGLSRAVSALRGEYYDVVEVVPAQGIAPEIGVLVAAGLRSTPSETALARLTAWLESGGKLLALIDPGRPALAELLEPWGLRVTGERILEPGRNFAGDPEFLKVTSYTDHQIVEGFGGSLPTGFPVASPVENFEADPQLLFHSGLAATSDFANSLARDGTRRQGPFHVAAAVWVKPELSDEGQTRIVLVGDSDFAANQYLTFRANRNFFLNCVGWLSRETALVSVRKRADEDPTLDLGLEDRTSVLMAAFAMPILVTLFGIVVLLRRRGL